MSELHLPWLEAAVLAPLIGAAFVKRQRDPERARQWALGFSAIAFCCAFGAWQDFESLHSDQADDRWRPGLLDEVEHGLDERHAGLHQP